MVSIYDPFEVNPYEKGYFSAFTFIALVAEEARDFKTAQYYYSLSGHLYKAYQMKKNQRTLAEKDKINKRVSKKFLERIASE